MKLKKYSKEKPLKVVVDRKRWLRGKENEDVGTSGLLRKGKQCCLGFACRTIGFTSEQINNKRAPAHLGAVIPGLVKSGRNCWNELDFLNTSTCESMMQINDYAGPDSEREKRITSLGKKIGLKFVFKG